MMPLSFSQGALIGQSNLLYTAEINDIGTPGAAGFGVGTCPAMPAGVNGMSGTPDKYSDNYGNYQYSDGSIMCWIPAFFYKYGTGSNGLSVNEVDIKKFNYFADVATANASGYALHRAFYNGGAVQSGVFVDKYLCSNNGGIASSIKNGNPLSSNSVHNPFSGLTGAPANFYYGAIAAAKTRGSAFFCSSRFIASALALLALAHGAAATSTATCAWYDASDITNYPKGNNNNALSDTNDGTLTFVSDGYPNAAKTGSASNLAKITHNGQSCGVADLNGNMWEIQLGMTSNGANFYLLKTSVDIAAITPGNTLATDAWGATGIAALYDNIGATYGALTASSSQKTFGNAGKVFDDALSGNAWAATGAGIPLLVGGANKFGNDGLWDYRLNELCPLAGGSWYSGATGVWALHLFPARGYSGYGVGFRAALYL